MTDSPLNCQRCLDLLDDYRRDALSVLERGQLEAHLAECPKCLEELNFRNGLGAALRSSLPEGGDRTAVLSPAVKEALAAARHKHDRPRKSPMLPWMLTAAVLIVGAIAFVQTSGMGLLEDRQTISLNDLPEKVEAEQQSMGIPFDATSGTSSSGDVYRTQGFQDKELTHADEKGKLAFDAPAQVMSEAAPASVIAEHDSAEYKLSEMPAAAAPMAGAAGSERMPPPAAPMGAMQQQAQVMSAPPAEPGQKFYGQAKAKRELTSRAAPKKDSAVEERSADLQLRSSGSSGPVAAMYRSADYGMADKMTTAGVTSATLLKTTDTLTSSPR